MPSEQYEVFPEEDGWAWRLRGEDGEVSDASWYGSRTEAISAAQEARGDVVTKLYTADGAEHSEDRQRGWQRILLLRADGSLCGELDHEIRAGGPPTYVDIHPAEESSEAVSVDG